MSHEIDEKPKPMSPRRASPLPRPTRLPGITPRLGPSATRNPDTIASSNYRTHTMIDPQIVCPNCRTEIKLTESLAAPLLADARRQFEQQLASTEADFGRREAGLKKTKEDLARAREAIDDQVATKLKAERAAIDEAEARKASVSLPDERG